MAFLSLLHGPSRHLEIPENSICNGKMSFSIGGEIKKIIQLFLRTSWPFSPTLPTQPGLPLPLVTEAERGELLFTNCNIFVIFVLLSVLQDLALPFCNVNREKKSTPPPQCPCVCTCVCVCFVCVANHTEVPRSGLAALDGTRSAPACLSRFGVGGWGWESFLRGAGQAHPVLAAQSALLPPSPK